jgi:hypothetical protein
MHVRHLLFFCVVLVVSLRTIGQDRFNDSIADARNGLVQKSMITLGSWALVNIGTGFPIAGSTSGETRYFWRMNAYWNFVNLGLAGMGYLNAIKAASRKYSFSDNIKAQNAIEKIYVFNFGLDLAYIAGGFYLRERGNSTSTIKSMDEFKGYGTSIITQGVFLLVMDGVVYLLHHNNTIRAWARPL